ncbi:MAG: GAF domain-containing protein, partial [Opitutaceae bacterium]|nr:GAF domain-containing protein [Verrucomicrobiales bacterium]
MAGNHRVRYLAGPARLAVIVALAAAAHGQTRLTLRQTAEREPPAYTPRHAGERIVVSGVVSGLPVRILGYQRVYIQDAEEGGLAIDSADSILDGLRPGDAVEASGRLVNHMGLPVLRPESIRKSGAATVPVPRPATVEELNGFKRLGTLISIEQNVVAPGENAGGDILILGKSPSAAITVFLPRESRSTGSELSDFRPGDRVRVTGVSSQYCPIPPHTRAFQVLIGSPQAVTLLARGWRVSSGSIFGTSLALMSAVVFWSIRERSLLRQRKRLRILTGLAEEAVGATSAADIQRRLNDGMPGVVSRSKTRLYLFNTLANALEAVPVAEAGEPAVVDPREPADSLSGAIALCFNNRTLLHIPDTAASPILSGENPRELPRSMLLAPMRASEEVLGVLVVMCFGNRHRFHVDEQTSLQHVANQVATSFKLQDQQSMREQLLRTEKMAAAGQLISRVADEL